MKGRTLQKKPSWITSIILLIILGFSTSAKSEEIQIFTEDNTPLIAQLWQGDGSKPNVIILHGFLQTYQFSTVERLAESLSDNGFTVLAPNLSLGIPNRKAPLPCEALQLHSPAQNAVEIEQWHQWLQQQNNRPIALVGHSDGSLQAISYLNRYPDAKIYKALLISLIHISDGINNQQPSQHYQKATELKASGDRSIYPFELSYCKEFVTTAENILSYYFWSAENIVKTIRSTQTPMQVVFGGEDPRISEQWRQMVEESGVGVIPIEGANHFFDQEFEFDLHEIINELLSSIIKPTGFK